MRPYIPQNFAYIPDDVRVIKLADHYGTDADLEKLSEEALELHDAAEEFLDGDECDEKLRSALVSECVDVQIMLQRIRYDLQIKDSEWNTHRNFKLDRQIDRVERESEINTKE